MSRLGTITRRSFLVAAAAVAGGVAFGYYKYQQPFANPLEDDLAEGEATFNPWIKIGSDNSITIIAPRAEMGQGTYTTLAAMVAEELDVTLEQIAIVHGPGAPAYYNTAMLTDGAPFAAFDNGVVAESVRAAMGVVGKFLALQGTGGSSSMVDGFERMRQAGASAREMLKAAAAQKLGVKADSLTTAAGVVTDPASGKMLTYGELALDAAKVAPVEVVLRDPKAWKILGKDQKRKDMLAKITGAPIFGIDADLPDMVYATVKMNPQPGGKMRSFDPATAKTMKGVQKVIAIDSPYGQGFAVIADNTWRAFQAADAVIVEWENGPHPRTSADIEVMLTDTLKGTDSFTLRTVGDPDVVFADAPREKIVEADYFTPYLSHAAMEPMNATAQMKDGKLQVWAPNQSPTIIKLIGSRITGLADDKIAVHTTFLGGGFGRRLEPDFTDYAVRIALQTGGKPVKVTWSREEDMSHGPYRPAAKAHYKAVLDDKGMPKAVAGSIASPSVMASAIGRILPSITPAGPDNTVIDGGYNQPYGIENFRVDGRKAPIGIPVGFWRSVGYSYNCFMHESFMDEMAHAGNIDPFQLRRTLLKDHPPALGVVEKVAAMSGWETALPAGKARGMAFSLSFNTYVAQVVQVADVGGSIRIENVWCAADPGIVLDPNNFKAQMMSGIIFGLSAATNQEITFADGAVEQMNFSDHDGLRMNQAPAIEVEILQNSARMGGAGEPSTPPSMPALANAIFALNGKRIRSLPLGKAITFV
jgi:isoquinoline 1-oxidoreductase subunit beta